jgi:menaquinol-cytochrome c reductase iron-sulfur subunit
MSNVAVDRRSFLNLFTDLLIAIIGLIVAIPALSYFSSPLRRKGDEEDTGFQDLGPLADIPTGTWSLRTLEVVQADGWKKTRVRHSIWVRRQGEGEKGFTVLSPICPHLGCPINWHTDQRKFICPCHGGIFDADGRFVGGPPPRGMDVLDFEIRAGRLGVRWQDFKIGVSTRIGVSA